MKSKILKHGNQKTFVTIFPFLENIHLDKDVGMIPNTMAEHYGYESYIACYDTVLEGSLPKLGSSTPHLHLLNTIHRCLPRGSDMTFDVFVWLLRNARSIDVLNTYHLVHTHWHWLWLYKLLNPSGKIYMKLDMPKNEPDRLLKTEGRKMYLRKRKMLQICDVVSAEYAETTGVLDELYGIHSVHVPNGVCNVPPLYDCARQNAFLTVGRLGFYTKATDILLAAYAKSGVGSQWKLILAGGKQDGFDEMLQSFQSQYPSLAENIICTGPVTDRVEMNRLYQSCKCFVLPSRNEACATVMAEASSNGCFEILSLPASRNAKAGLYPYETVVPAEDIDALAEAMRKTAQEDFLPDSIYEDIREYTCSHLTWKVVLAPVCERLSS